MATSTLLQCLNDDAAMGASMAASGNRRSTEVFLAKETLLVGDWVAFDFGATGDGDVVLGVYKADANSSPVRTPFGVVVGSKEQEGTLTAGSRVEVAISGVVDAFTLDASGSGMAIGSLLQISNTAGQVDAASAASAQPICGILAETVAAAAGAGLRRVVVRRSF